MTKKRRIQPIAVDEDAELEVATLPVPAFSAQPTDSTRIVDPPEEGRRIWVSLDDGYDFSYKKILQHKGVKPCSRAKDASGSQQAMPAMPGMPGSSQMEGGKPGEQGNQMQKAMRRIERRVQREHMVAVTGNAEADSDEDMEDPEAEAADGDVAQLDEDGKDDNDKEDGEEEKEYEQSKGPKNQYDLNDDFIDDSEFIEAIQMRDDRKLKHQGFFVNSGAVERIGDRVPVVAAARARNKKKRNLPVDGEEAQAGEQAAKPAKAASKGTNKAAKKDSAQVGASEDSAPAAKAPRIATAAGASNAAASDAAAEAPALSIVELAMQAGNMAAAGTSQAATDPAQATTQPITYALSPVQHPGDTSAAPHAAAANGQLLSDRPPMGPAGTPVMPSPAATSGQPPGSASAAAPSPSTAAHTAPDASTDGQMEAHEARMLGLPLDAAEEMMAGLGAWNPTQRFREVLEQMRAEAARTTPPGVGGTKKKMPQELAVCLEALVRPFYISADAAPNVNKAKRAMWSLMMPILTPWSAENTIKTKMQKVNTQVLGAYQLEKNKLEGIAQWTASVGLTQGLNATRTLAIIHTFVDATVACDATPLTAADAEMVWDAVAEAWNNAGGPILNGALVQTLYRRALDLPASDVAAADLQQDPVAEPTAGAVQQTSPNADS